ncbi:ribosome biogenesis GTPase A-like protein [Trifolium pratense]|uniref:Ribosome biogenesis GTPase A-like protein n=1 Tax=Trifolium pratense TaxID=57577 RepID=A0A2K3N3I0_TRIPR|nr:ribosome biogenesis GTPase A-like protein [Trifolium pratense]
MVTMSVQFQVSSSSSSCLWLPNSPSPPNSPLFLPTRTTRFSSSPLAATPTFSSQSPTIQIIGNHTFDGSNQGGTNLWTDLDTDLYHWTKVLRPVQGADMVIARFGQWFPGHIAKAEKELKEQLKLMDVVIEMDLWLGNRKRILVLNREDMISTADRNAWAEYFTRRGIKVVFSNGQLGMGAMKLGRLAKELAADVNVKRRAKGLLPRPVGCL